MKLTKLDLSQEKKIITNMITSDTFLKQIAPLFHPNQMKTPYGRLVGQWCMEFYEKYNVAPGKNIADIYQEKRGAIKDDDDVDLVATFLQHLSAEYETSVPNNVEYSLQSAILYLKTRSLEMLVEQVQDSLQKNDPLSGEQALSNYNRIEYTTGEGVSILHDSQAILDAFNEEEEFLFKFPGAIGEVAGNFNRGDFAAFLGPGGRGKSFFLWYTAEIAMQNGLKVVFFTMEMTKNQIIRRAYRSIVGKPLKTCTVQIPYFSIAEEEPIRYEVLQKEEEREGIDFTKIEQQQKKLRRLLRSGDVRIIELPAGSVWSDINVHLDNMEYYDNYMPDVIVIDYADLLVASKRAGKEYRHQLDDIWKGLRSIVKDRKIFGMTASHANKETFERDIKKSDTSEDGRKMNHVTAAIALNQREDEASQGIMRLKQLKVREGRPCFEQAVVLQCLDIGKPCLDSKLQKEMVKEKDKNEDKIYKKRWNYDDRNR